MKLHWQRVRRARRLPVPLPPEPKRPLGPPVLFGFRDVSIRTRADAIEASGSWEAFLDDMADLYVDPPVEMTSFFLEIIEGMVPPAEREAHREAMLIRIRQRRWPLAEDLAELRAKETMAKPGLVARLLGRAA